MRKKSAQNNAIGYFPNQDSGNGSQKDNTSHGGTFASWRFFVIGGCLVVFVVCGIMLISYALDAVKTKRLNDLAIDIDFYTTVAPAESIEPTPQPTSAVIPSTPFPVSDKSSNDAAISPQPTLQNPWPSQYPNNALLRISSAFYGLRETYKNNDICAYLEIDDVVAGQPVVQKDNSFYLNHSVDKKPNQNGTLFIDENCNLTTVPTQIVVYGHNMKDGLAFGPLKKYATKNAAFFQANPFITFNTLYENGRYVIFAIIDDLDIRAGQPNYLPFWNYVKFSSAEAFNDYIIKAKALSKIHCNVDVVPGDRLLVLSTCVGTNEYQKNLRFVILARKIRENESEFDLRQKILTSTDR